MGLRCCCCFNEVIFGFIYLAEPWRATPPPTSLQCSPISGASAPHTTTRHGHVPPLRPGRHHEVTGMVGRSCCVVQTQMAPTQTAGLHITADHFPHRVLHWPVRELTTTGEQGCWFLTPSAYLKAPSHQAFWVWGFTGVHPSGSEQLYKSSQITPSKASYCFLHSQRRNIYQPSCSQSKAISLAWSHLVAWSWTTREFQKQTETCCFPYKFLQRKTTSLTH